MNQWSWRHGAAFVAAWAIATALLVAAGLAEEPSHAGVSVSAAAR